MGAGDQTQKKHLELLTTAPSLHPLDLLLVMCMFVLVYVLWSPLRPEEGLGPLELQVLVKDENRAWFFCKSSMWSLSPHKRIL